MSTHERWLVGALGVILLAFGILFWDAYRRNHRPSPCSLPTLAAFSDNATTSQPTIDQKQVPAKESVPLPLVVASETPQKVREPRQPEAPATPATPSAFDLTRLAKIARPSVMYITCYDAEGKEISSGTGFLVSPDGKLVTNFHVIKTASSVVAKAENGGLFPATGILSSDAKNDLVILKIQGKNLPVLLLENTAPVEPGVRIAVIGSPLGLEGTLSEGIVSAIRDIQDSGKVWLQITAAISPGSSGSPVLNQQGHVIGIAVALIREGQSINFAVPVEHAKALLAKAENVTAPQPFTPAKKPMESLADKRKQQTNDLKEEPESTAYYEAFKNRDWVEMLKHAKTLVRKHPDNPEAVRRLASAYGFLGLWNDAVAAYQLAVKLDPDDWRLWQSLGDAYGGAGLETNQASAYGNAISVGKKTMDDPNGHMTYFEFVGLAVLCETAGRWDDAVYVWQRFLTSFDEDKALPLMRIGKAYSRGGHKEEARKVLERLRELDAKLAEELAKELK